MEEQEFSPVKYVGTLSLNNSGNVDVGPLEGRASAMNLIATVPAKKGVYHCYKGIDPLTSRVSAIMIVHPDYPDEALVTEEYYGDAYVGLSGSIGFFRSPKKEYTMKQMGEYLGDLAKKFPPENKDWHILNTSQFFAPANRMPGSAVALYVHRDANGEIDAMKLEFDHLAQRNPEEAVRKAEA